NSSVTSNPSSLPSRRSATTRSNRSFLAAAMASRPVVQPVTSKPIAVNRIFTRCSSPSSSSTTRICSFSMKLLLRCYRFRHGRRRCDRRWGTNGTNLIPHFLIDALQCFQLARQLLYFPISIGQLLLQRQHNTWILYASMGVFGVLPSANRIAFPVTLG